MTDLAIGILIGLGALMVAALVVSAFLGGARSAPPPSTNAVDPVVQSGQEGATRA